MVFLDHEARLLQLGGGALVKREGSEGQDRGLLPSWRQVGNTLVRARNAGPGFPSARLGSALNPSMSGLGACDVSTWEAAGT